MGAYSSWRSGGPRAKCAQRKTGPYSGRSTNGSRTSTTALGSCCRWATGSASARISAAPRLRSLRWRNDTAHTDERWSPSPSSADLEHGRAESRGAAASSRVSHRSAGKSSVKPRCAAFHIREFRADWCGRGQCGVCFAGERRTGPCHFFGMRIVSRGETRRQALRLNALSPAAALRGPRTELHVYAAPDSFCAVGEKPPCREPFLVGPHLLGGHA